MLEDVWTVARKEMLETVANPKTRRQTLVGLGFLILFVDIMPAVTARSYWGSIGIAFGMTMFTLVIGPMMTTADSVAGERERHTLETLLSTRLPDSSIVLGKLLALTIMSVGSAVLFVLQAIIVISALFGIWKPFPFLLLGTLGILVFGTIASLFLSALGILVSMRAQTVQGAAQALTFVMMPLFMLPGIGLAFIGFDRLDAAAQFFVTVPPFVTASLVLLAVIGLDVLFVALVVRAFRRPRLMKS